MTSNKPFEGQLSKIGFSDKESRVYLASLELGSATAQQISIKSGVKRASVYVMIESLMDRGLMATFEKGKKSYFVAESPNRIVGIVDDENKVVQLKKQVLDDVLGDLLALHKSISDKPKVIFFEGIEGLRTIYDDILKLKADRLDNIVALDDAEKIDSPNEHLETFRKALEKRGVAVRIICASKIPQSHLPLNRMKNWSTRFIDPAKFPLHGEVTLYGDKVAAFSYRGKIFGTIIESKEISQTLRVMFDLAWMSCK